MTPGELWSKLRNSVGITSSTPDYNIYILSPLEFLQWTVIGIILDALFSYTFYKSIVLFLVLLPFALLLPFYQRKALCAARKQRLLLEFKEALSILSSFLSAGYSTENAFRAAIPELKQLFQSHAMIVLEFQKIVQGMTLNKPVEDLLSDFAYRSGLDDITNFAEVFIVAKRNGGQLVQILSHSSEIIREKIQVQEEIRTLNANRRYEQKIMNLIPFLIILYMNFSSPGFFLVLYETFLGRVTMTVCLILYLTALYLSERIMNIEI
ncbi:MAG TPA: type II secretion system protein F [Oribacterium sp.]|nr:type II secretion system protein F [Oribacterium sp.]